MAVFSSCSRNSVKFLQPPTVFFNDYKYFLAVTIPLFLPETSFGNWKYMLFLLISFADFSGAFRAYVDLDEWVCRDWRKIFRTHMFLQFLWLALAGNLGSSLCAYTEQKELGRTRGNFHAIKTHRLPRKLKIKIPQGTVLGRLSEWIQLWGAAKMLSKEESDKTVEHEKY